jgi:ureidoacrylate peracid hydrolase
MAKIARLNERLSAEHTALVLFDALNGYLHPHDPVKKEFLAKHHILSNLGRLLTGARTVGMVVFYPAGAHGPDGTDTVERLTDTDMDLGPGSAEQPIKPRFHAGSPEARIAPELAPAKGDVVVPKQRWNAFFQTNLDLQLRARGIDTIVLAGGSTDVGIASTAFAARDLDYGLVIVRDACYSMRGSNNEFFMDRVFPRMGRVMTVEKTVGLME